MENINARGGWFRNLSPLERFGLYALVATAAVVIVVAVAPKATAAAVGGGLAALGAKAITFAFDCAAR